MVNKIEAGQCYRVNDHVYMVIEQTESNTKLWVVENTLTKKTTVYFNDQLEKMERPFQNFG